MYEPRNPKRFSLLTAVLISAGLSLFSPKPARALGEENIFTAAFTSAIRFGTIAGGHIRKDLADLAEMEKAIRELKPLDRKLADRLLYHVNELDNHLQSYTSDLGWVLWKVANERVQYARAKITRYKKNVDKAYQFARSKNTEAFKRSFSEAEKELSHLSVGIQNGKSFLSALSAVLP